MSHDPAIAMNTTQTTIADALRGAAGVTALEARLLLLHVLQRPARDHAWLLAHDHDALPAEQCAAFNTLCLRRQQGEPLAYLTGVHEFFGLPLRVDARVLDPRPDTETLVEWALTLAQTATSPGHDAPTAASANTPSLANLDAPQLLDLGTGSGAIALALAYAWPQPVGCPPAQVTAVDASAAALEVARANGQALGLPVRWLLGHWFAPLAADARFDCIVSNPPYIAAGDAHLPALRHEPQQALVSGADGLDDLRHIVAHAPAHLRPGGWLLLEHGWDQASAVRTLLHQAGFYEVQSRRDLAGIERCSGGCWAPPTPLLL